MAESIAMSFDDSVSISFLHLGNDNNDIIAIMVIYTEPIFTTFERLTDNSLRAGVGGECIW